MMEYNHNGGIGANMVRLRKPCLGNLCPQSQKVWDQDQALGGGEHACFQHASVVLSIQTCFEHVELTFQTNHKALARSRRNHDLKLNQSHSAFEDLISTVYLKDHTHKDLSHRVSIFPLPIRKNKCLNMSKLICKLNIILKW